MPSTFSPSLRVELIGAGEQAGTWSTTTNTNLGTILEDSIAGFESVSVTSANQALTQVNGAVDQARNAILQLTTTTSAAFAIYAPPSSKQYIILNTSAQTATIFNSTVLGNTTPAGDGVAIPAGQSLVVYTDGTDFKTLNIASTPKLVTTNFTIEESGGKLIFKNGATIIASLSSTGVFTALNDVTSHGTP